MDIDEPTHFFTSSDHDANASSKGLPRLAFPFCAQKHGDS